MTASDPGRDAAVVRRTFAVAILLGAALVGSALFARGETEHALDRAAYALADERYRDALAESEALLAEHESPRARLLAGCAAAKLLDTPTSLSHLERVPDDGTRDGVEARLHRGLRYAAKGRARDAERELRSFLEAHPNHPVAAEQLAWLLAVQGRTWESVPFQEAVVRNGVYRADELILIGSPDRFFADDDDSIRRYLEAVPDDPGPRLAVARERIEENDVESALVVLREVVAGRPDLEEARARLAALTLRAGDPGDVDVTLGESDHPLARIVEARRERARSNSPNAVPALRTAVLQGPTFTEANLLLSQSLRSAGRSRESKVFAERARRLSTMNYLYSELSNGYDAELVKRLIEHLVAMDRHWEAFAWAELVLRRPGETPAWAFEVYERERTLALTNTGPFVPPPAALGTLAPPAPDNPAETRGDRPEETEASDQPQRALAFRNVADEVGLHFDYHNGTTRETGLQHMLQATGGGVAVLDYDGDGWSDLYFVQACEWPVEGQTKYRNALLRNVEGRRFEDVTREAGVGDTGYGQGVTVGDFDNDGDPDLYVCNVGPNRLYRNDDGVFVDVTDEAGVAGNEWTTSAVLADLDGDALPDLYVVNYLKLDEVLARQCKHDGRPMGCAPTMFTAEQDRVYRNLGNGRFEEVTDECGVRVPGGKGLSVVAFDADGSGRLSLFVGNDTTANFLFENQTEERGRLQLVEQGIAAGAALDEAGLAQATMGVAVGDADGDTRLDFFVTNFHGESNTFYRGVEGAGFVDETRRTGLRDPGFGMLGFGTEFLDADLDGHLDLLVANGHVDRTFATGVADRMPPQLFRNRGGGRFVEVPTDDQDGYFAGRYLGRSLAVLDWNRDGRPDAVVSHIDAPAALLENRTDEVGHHLVVELEGRASARDAYGTRVTLVAGDRTHHAQLTAGGGYEVVNERLLHFGVGDATAVDSLRVEWPSGTVDVIEGLEVDQRVRVVEGQNTAESSADPKS